MSDLLTINLYKCLALISTPLPTKTITDELLLDLISQQRTKPNPPISYRLVENINSTLMKIFGRTAGPVGHKISASCLKLSIAADMSEMGYVGG